MFCTTVSAQAVPDSQDHSANQHHKHHQQTVQPELVIKPIGLNTLNIHEKNNVVLSIKDKQNKAVDVSRFEVVHTEPVHLLIIEPGLEDYHHEHPDQKSTGQYNFSFTPHTACSYRVWADVKLKGSNQQYIPIDLEGTKECNDPIKKIVNRETSSQGYDFNMEFEGYFEVGKSISVNIHISKNGQPVEYLEPVMGAFAHMVGFYEDYETIAHVHPLGPEPTDASQRGGPILRFHIKPEREGYLKLFGQVQINGKQIFAPFGVVVAKN